MAPSYFFQRFHHKLVIVNSHVGFCVNGGKLMLRWGNLIVLGLGGNP